MKTSNFSQRVYAGVITVALGLFPAVALTSGATAVGVGDITTAMRYDQDGTVIGEVATEIQDSDDDSYLIEAPWPMNFFGRKFDGLCVTSNGTVSPVVYDGGNASCDDSYDDPMADLADSAGSPLIAAFSNDNDLGETVKLAEKTVSGFSVAGDPSTTDSVVTVTTSTAHGLESGDVRSVYVIDTVFNNGNEDDNRTDEYWYEDVTVTVLNSTQFTFSGDSAENGDGSFTPSYPAGVKSGTVAVDQGWVWDDNGEDVDGVDDGIGKINTIYVGETTVDGRDAWIYTNYRSVTNDTNNPDILTNTFQIVLIKRTTLNGDTRGYDFDIEYNFGAVKDGDDGYSAEGGSCGSMNSDCRTGVGIADPSPGADGSVAGTSGLTEGFEGGVHGGD